LALVILLLFQHKYCTDKHKYWIYFCCCSAAARAQNLQVSVIYSTWKYCSIAGPKNWGPGCCRTPRSFPPAPL